jgi:predicted GIY-YIG superfamily endonuclease
VGHTHDLEARVRAHNEGRGPGYTPARRPVKLVYSEAFPGKSAAVRRERQITKWSGAKKEALIRGDLERLRDLSKGKARRPARSHRRLLRDPPLQWIPG